MSKTLSSEPYALTPGPAIEPGCFFASEQQKAAALRELLAHVATTPAPARRPKKLNMLDQEPLNALERHALSELRHAAERGSSHAAVLQELIGRLSRALESYRSNYLPPIN